MKKKNCLQKITAHPANIYLFKVINMFKVNNKNTRTTTQRTGLLLEEIGSTADITTDMVVKIFKSGTTSNYNRSKLFHRNFLKNLESRLIILPGIEEVKV